MRYSFARSLPSVPGNRIAAPVAGAPVVVLARVAPVRHVAGRFVVTLATAAASAPVWLTSAPLGSVVVVCACRASARTGAASLAAHVARQLGTGAAPGLAFRAAVHAVPLA